MSLEHSPARAAYSVNDFCKAHGISRSLFYKALKEGWGPTIMKCAGRTLISLEAAEEWRRSLERAEGDAAREAKKGDAP